MKLSERQWKACRMEEKMREYITPNDADVMAESDSKSIQNAVDEAKKTGINKVVIPRINKRTEKGRWDVDKAIIITSNLEIVLDNCYIRQMDGSIDNVFINHVHDNPYIKAEEEQENIRIIGIGNAVIDGGKPNGLEEFTSLENGLPHISKNNPILLHNVRGLTIDNITIRNPRWWAINLLYVENARISNVTIDAQDNIRNQDGIDLRIGCHNIVVENIFGQSGDDLIALSGFWGGRESDVCAIEGKDRDIHDIIIRNIVGTSAECAIIALRNTDGVKLYNVLIDGVFDTLNGIKNADPKNGHIFEKRYEWKQVGAKTPYAAVRIGQGAFFRKRNNKMGETFAITVKNVHVRSNAAIMLNATLEKSRFENIHCGKDARTLISTKSSFDNQKFGVDLKDVVFENLYYTDTERDDSVAFDFAVTKEMNFFKNVFIRNAFIGRCKKVLNMEHEGRIVFDGLFADSHDFEKKENAEVIVNGNRV